MHISVVKETAEFENRVALTPDLVKRLCDAGHTVVVEKNAGHSFGWCFLDHQSGHQTHVCERAWWFDRLHGFGALARGL